nr:ParB/RepB/Spo0J family partition protein [Deinococcus aestuarii]
MLGEATDLTRAQSAEQSLPVASLRPGPVQPRRAFTETGLQDLARSMREHGVLQPLLVRPVGDGYEIVAGERRWRAAGLAGLSEVPVVVRTLSDEQARVAALIENLQREDLNVIDEVDAKLGLVALALGLSPEDARARLMQLLREVPGPDHQTVETVFAPLGEGWETFAKNKLRLLNWPAPLLEALRGGLPYTLAAVVAGAPAEHQARLIELATGGATRSALREEVQRLGRAQGAGEPSQALEAVRRLSSRRFMARLTPEDRRSVERWLAKMPPVLREQPEDVT